MMSPVSATVTAPPALGLLGLGAVDEDPRDLARRSRYRLQDRVAAA